MGSKKRRDKLGLDDKYLRFLWAYTRGCTRVNYPPQWLMVEPTNRCNLSCVMCPQAGKLTRPQGFMDYELFCRLMDEASTFAKNVQLFHTGEALLHPRIFAMISYAASKGLYTLINSNGTLLDARRAPALLDSGLDSLSFSFDSFDKKTYESIRRGASYEKTLANIEHFLELKGKRRQRQPKTIIEIIDMIDTRPHLDTFVRRAKDMGFDEVRVWKFHNWTEADEVAAAHSPYQYRRRSFYPCEYPYVQMAIYWDGMVVPCCVDYNGKYPLGDASRQSLLDIWNDQRLARLRHGTRSRSSSPPDLCRDCSFLWEPKSYCSAFGKLFSGYARFLGAIRA